MEQRTIKNIRMEIKMNGCEFIQKINDIESCVAMLNEGISKNDEIKLSLDNSQQREIRAHLKHYKELLLKSDLSSI